MSDVKALGAGSPIVDYLVQVSEEFVASIEGDKGGMVLVEEETMDDLLGRIEGPVTRAPGGSAGNTIAAMARMGLKCAFLGKLGMDEDGRYYRDAFAELGGDTDVFKSTTEAHTARCLSMITPDSQRTMRTDLGAATLLAPNEISVSDFASYSHAHVEGYLLFNADLAEAVLKSAKEAGCKVSLDLGSFEVVAASKDDLPRLLEEYVDCVFANEDEAEAFCGLSDPEGALDALSKHCEVAAVKLGAQGAHLRRGDETCFVPANKIDPVVDTTGAGDCWAAGFLYGHLMGYSLQVCGELGHLLGGECVRVVGAAPGPDSWNTIRERLAQLG